MNSSSNLATFVKSLPSEALKLNNFAFASASASAEVEEFSFWLCVSA